MAISAADADKLKIMALTLTELANAQEKLVGVLERSFAIYEGITRLYTGANAVNAAYYKDQATDINTTVINVKGVVLKNWINIDKLLTQMNTILLT